MTNSKHVNKVYNIIINVGGISKK